MQNYIIRPVISEKTFKTASKGWYTFVVDMNAEKKQIASSIHKHFGVDVTNVRTLTVKGKTRRVGKRQAHIQKPDWKKAMVKLKAGQKIDIFEVPTQEETVKTGK